MIDNEVVARIAQKILDRSVSEKNLTIQQLSSRANVNKGLLSKVENSRTVPSLPVFITLIQSLDISLKEFFEDMVLINGRDYLLVKKTSTRPWNARGVRALTTSTFSRKHSPRAPWRP